MDWSIKQTTKKLGVSARALRYYEQRGLLTPRRIGAIRYYGEEQRTRILRILGWKQLGFSIASIKALLEQSDSVVDDEVDLGQIADQIDFLTRRQTEIARALQALTRLQTEAERCGPAALGAVQLSTDTPDSPILNLHRADEFTRKGA